MEFGMHAIRLLNMNCYLYYREQEALLIDCGNRGSGRKILKAMEELGLPASALKILFLTHCHYDHAGAAAELQELTGCSILVQKAEAGRLEQGKTPFPGGTRWKARALVGLGRTFMPGLMKYPPARADIILEGDADLEAYGFPLKAFHVPGHSPGSQLIVDEDGALISGDSFFGLEGKLHFPPFAENVPQLLESWGKIKALHDQGLFIDSIHPAHGHSFPFSNFLEEYPEAMKRYGRTDP